MSAAFAGGPRREPVTQATIQKMLDENTQLIQAIIEYQNQGKARECTQYQQILHRNLIYLATLADSSLNLQSQLNPSNSGGMAHGSAGNAQVLSNSGMSMARAQMPVNMSQPGIGMQSNDMTANQQSPAPNITVSGAGELPSHILNQQGRQGIPDMAQFNSGLPMSQNAGF